MLKEVLQKERKGHRSESQIEVKKGTEQMKVKQKYYDKV